MIIPFVFLVISIVVEILGVLQITKKAQRSALNWYFFAICTTIASQTLNIAMLYYTAFLEGVTLIGSSYSFSNYNIFSSSTKLLVVPLIFAFVLNLSKMKSKGLKVLQHILVTVNIAAFLALVIIVVLPIDTIRVLSSPSFSVWFILPIILSFCCIIYLLYKWIKEASLKRDRMQAVTMTISSMIILSSFFAILAFPNSWGEVITFIGAMIFIVICNHYANQYNSFSFNITNLAGYVYSSVKLPVLILDVSGNIMLCNASSESFFQKSADQIIKLKLFDLFTFENGFSSPGLHKKEAIVFNYDAISRVKGQKCQISFNYIYDKYDEMICTVAIVTDITEKENLIRELNESKAIIEKYNRELQFEVERQTVNIRNLQEAIVYSMSDLIEKKDGYTGGHTRRVSGYVSIMLGELARRGFSFTEPEIKRVAESSLLHDMGKIAIPDSILLKNGKLTADEFDVMKSHSSAGADSLQKSMQFAKDNKFLENAFAMAKHHHEKWNGGGYPDGKSGEEIPFLARVTAIADVYDALRSERPYKEPFSREKAKAIILEENGHQFDPDLVNVFLSVEPEFNAICESYKLI